MTKRVTEDDKIRIRIGEAHGDDRLVVMIFTVMKRH